MSEFWEGLSIGVGGCVFAFLAAACWLAWAKAADRAERPELVDAANDYAPRPMTAAQAQERREREISQSLFAPTREELLAKVPSVTRNPIAGGDPWR